MKAQLTEVHGVCVEYGQADKLLGDLGPSGDEESEKVSALEYRPPTNLLVHFGSHALDSNSGGHDFL